MLTACASDDGPAGAPTSATQGILTTASETGPEPTTAGPSSSGDQTSVGPGVDTTSTDGGGDPCLFCDGPNERCVDDECVTTCQGVAPDPCGPAEVCDVISGECRAPDAACTLAGPNEACDAAQCGPGSVCDGQGSCIAVAPCADVACLETGECWGTSCSCERAIDCATPSEVDLNGPFSSMIGGLDFADDCTAWMVTLRSGVDYVRRLTPDGTLTEWAGVSNLNMGEIKVLKALTPPPGLVRDPTRAWTTGARPGESDDRGLLLDPPEVLGGLGDVAITYTCCSNCGCQATPPQGVARLVQDDAANPLPLVIESVITTGTGPFGTPTADSGPFGLTWGIDRVLYVGNSTANGEIVTADLELQTQAALANLPGRITAGAPISAVHLLFAIEGGEIYRFNVLTAEATLLVDLESDVTSLSHDAFDGRVYAGLRSLEVVAIRPHVGIVEPFDTMPGRGRVTVSPDGRLWFSPLALFEPNAIFAWELPVAL